MSRTILLLFSAIQVVAACAAETTVSASTPPTDPNGWVREIQIADKLVAAGYLDAAQNDYENVIRRYPSTVAGIDKAWLGLARVHMARSELDQAKTSLESVLKRDSDPDSFRSAAATYKQLKSQADVRLVQLYRVVQAMEYRNSLTPWYDLLSILSNYLDLRTARQQLDTASLYAKSFDPHYLIDVTPSTAQPAGTTSDTATSSSAGQSIQTVHTPPTTVVATPSSSPSRSESASPTATSETTIPSNSVTPTVSTPSGNPVDPLAEKQRAYQAAYRKLQEALTSGDQNLVIQTNRLYQAALEEYRKAAGATP